MKFKTNYVEFVKDDWRYYPRYQGNEFLDVLAQLFACGDIDMPRFRQDLIDPASRGRGSDIIEIDLIGTNVFLKQSDIMKSCISKQYAAEPYDYLITMKRKTLYSLINDWILVTDKHAPQIYIICKNGVYYMSDLLPEDIDSYTDASNPAITFVRSHITLKKHGDYYAIKFKSNLFLNALATLLNDVTSDTSWFRNDLLNPTPKIIEGQLSQIEINGDHVVFRPSGMLIAKLKYYNYYEIEIGRTDLLRITSEWDNFVQKDVKKIFIIYKNNKYSISKSTTKGIDLQI